MQFYKNIQLRTKLIVGFVLSSLITMLVGFYAVQKLNQVNDAGTMLYERATAPMNDLVLVSVNFQRIRVNMVAIAYTSSDSEMSEREHRITMLRESIDSAGQRIDTSLVTAEEQRVFDKYIREKKSFREMTNHVVNLRREKKFTEAQDLLNGDGREIAQRYQDAISHLVELKVNLGKELSESNDRLAKSSTNMVYYVLAIGFLFSLGQGLLLTRGTMKQLGEDPGYLAEISMRIADGDLNVEFRNQRDANGVYAVMQHMVASMKAKILEAERKSQEASDKAHQAEIATGEAEAAKLQAERARAEGMLAAATQLKSIVAVISTASESLSAQIEQCSHGSEEQSGRVRETATAMEEMNATVLEVARNAQQAAIASGRTRDEASLGVTAVEKTVSGIHGVMEQSIRVQEDMDALGKQAESIGQILDVIADIADQTNLLALNAAIEAARAGDAGRGFAVVADEVRKLAEKTMRATQEVDTAIKAIQDSTHANIVSVEKIAKAAKDSSDLSNQSGTALKKILEYVEGVNDQVQSIATASEEQSAASEEINHSVEQIATISVETATAMGHATQSVASLLQQAQVLQNMISQMERESTL